MRDGEPGEAIILPPPLQPDAPGASPSPWVYQGLRVITARVLAAEVVAAFESGDARRHECALKALLALVTASKNGS